uniref:Uncharacterized protein n=1 Tax=Arundo donax TaxID=35708 RepID=A0A0A9FMQ2_ARUDO
MTKQKERGIFIHTIKSDFVSNNTINFCRRSSIPPPIQNSFTRTTKKPSIITEC